jgi:predicted small secreted protein
MKKGLFWLGFLTGAIAGYWLYEQTKEAPLKPESVIEHLKQTYGREFKVVGSWIQLEPSQTTKDGIPYHIYQCGITGLKDDEPHYLEFEVDAYTGTVLKQEA